MPARKSIDNDSSSEEELSQLVSDARAHRRELDSHGQLHRPNHIPKELRLRYFCLSAVLLLYAGFSLVNDDVYIPGKRGRGTHFHGVPALILIAAMLMAVLNMISVVADHYDERDNERKYRRFSLVTEVLAWVLAAIAVVLEIFVFKGTSHANWASA
jgi:hypothetical protein